jgi:phospholipase C
MGPRALVTTRFWRRGRKAGAAFGVAAGAACLVLVSGATPSAVPTHRGHSVDFTGLAVRDCVALHSRVRHTVNRLVVRAAAHRLTRSDPWATARLQRLMTLATADEVRASGPLRNDLRRLNAALAGLQDTLDLPRRWDLRDDAMALVGDRTAAVWRRCGASTVQAPQLPPGAHKLKHIVFVMQENRSFDHYFGTFPGADGIPTRNGVPTICVPNPATGGCNRPFHDPSDRPAGGPHTAADSVADIDHGRMDGFIKAWNAARTYCHQPGNMAKPTCSANSQTPDVMGYRDGRDIPNYWAYAKHFVLQDHMFEPNLGWSQPSHLAMVSAWSAVCRDPYIAGSCHPSITFTDIDRAWPHQPSYGWTDITYLMQQHHVSWRFYVAAGSVNDCEGTTDEQIHCTPGVPGFDPIGTPEPWNPLPDFTDVRATHQVKFVQFHKRFFQAAADGNLPEVSWLEPDWYHSEHPPEPISLGQAWVTRVINAVMSGPDWKSTAIFVAWDDWGGFYDHVVPPKVDGEGYGIRVPAFMVSPYAKAGMIDHGIYSFDAYLKLVEDLFMHGQRLDPYTDGRWDPRPDVRANVKIQGNLLDEFDFSQKPIGPRILPPHPH